MKPVDADVRERVRRDFGTSFVLVAGAGTGKTTLLVDRIEALVRSGSASLTEIAAVTFTENAATTLKLKLRERLEAVRSSDGAATVERGRAAAALDVLEIAPIGTIHALCAAILQERPLESGVAPGFRVADETLAEALFAAAWEEWLSARLVLGDPVVLEALERGIPLDAESSYGARTSLRGFGRRLVEQRDLVPLVGEERVDLDAWRDELLAHASRIGGLLAGTTPGDLLASRLADLVELAERSRFLAGEALAAHLERLSAPRRNLGQKRNWPSAEALREARLEAEWAAEFPARFGRARDCALHARLSRALAELVRLYEGKKAALGLLDFLDLLLKTRDTLARSHSVRSYFRTRFRHLIVDEFQDTDPLQAEVADLLTRGRQGALVVVGDPKQSIYRFRRADVAVLDRVAHEAARSPGSAALHLTQSFRSRPAILRFVNRLFARLIQPAPDDDQTTYEAIAPPPGLSDFPAVLALRFDAPLAEGQELAAGEARAAARMLGHVARGGLTVRDLATGRERPSRAGDVMVLPRRLTQVRALEEALEGVGLRFSVEGGKSFFDRQEVHEALAALRAVDDPSDTVALVAALRSSFFSVSDQDLAAHVLSGGRLALGAADDPPPDDESLRRALKLLGRLHARRTRMSAAAVLETLFDETRVLAALAGSRRGDAKVANLEKVVALARGAPAAGALTLRAFADLLESRIQEAAEEPDLPATRAGDPETVRILTIHRAKGLEAPIVLIHDLADDYYSAMDVVPLRASGQVAIGFREGIQPPGWAELKSREAKRAQAEARRLQYVACTRARDWLIVPQPGASAQVGAFWSDLVSALASAPSEDVRIVDASDLSPLAPEGEAEDPETAPLGPEQDAVAARWEKERVERLDAGAYRPFAPVAVTRAARAVAPEAVTLGGSRAARAFGTLVHRLLEWAPDDRAPGESLATLARSLAPRLGLDAAAADRAAGQARGVLAHPLWARAQRAPHFRETPVWLPEDGQLLEGVVDLVIDEPEGLVVVDYKTDAVAEEQVIEQAAHHAPQLRSYGRALGLAWKRPVKERLVFFTELARAVPV